MIKLTKNFDNEEMCETSTGLDNVPSMENLVALTVLCVKVLQPARDYLNDCIFINSGFRSKKVNSAVKGSKTSQHMTGEAADITCFNNKILFDFIRLNCDFDQLIWEKGNKYSPAWVHVSFNRFGNNRKQIIYNY